MDNKYINIYNNFINYTRNKILYKSLSRNDNFSDRLTLFLLHFSFFLKNFKKEENRIILQEIYDFNFRQLELSIREIGYGDQSINKKMKDYINIFYGMLDKLHTWEVLSKNDKKSILRTFIDKKVNEIELVEYFDKYSEDLSNNTLNYYLKGVIK